MESGGFKMKQERTQILRDGLSALASINESCNAVSTKREFLEFTESRGLELIERDFNWKDLKDGFYLVNSEEYRKFALVEEFRQTGYGAWHIGSRISGLQERGKKVLIINGKRNRRFLLKEIQ